MKTISGHVMPKDVIVIRDGRVQSLDNYMGYDGVLYCIYSVKRLKLDDIFCSSLDGPDHGTRKKEVLQMFSRLNTKLSGQHLLDCLVW